MAANSLQNLAVALDRQGKLAEAESGYRQYLETVKKIAGNRPDELLSVNRTLPIHYDFLRGVLIKEGKLEEADHLRRETLATLRRMASALAQDRKTETQDLLAARGWTTSSPQTAPASGVIEFHDLFAPPDRAFYRALQQ